MRNKIIVPEISYISTERAQDVMDNFAKIMVTAYEVWRRDRDIIEQTRLDLHSPEETMQLFINEISGQ